MSYKTTNATVQQIIPTWEDVACDDCGAELECVIASSVNEDGQWEVLMPDGALIINLCGFYGGYFDDCGDLDTTMIFCGKCADKLREIAPVFDRKFKQMFEEF